MSKRHLEKLICPKCGGKIQEYTKPVYYECPDCGIFSYIDMLKAGQQQGTLDGFGGKE